MFRAFALTTAAVIATALPTRAQATQAPLILIQEDDGGITDQFDQRARKWAAEGAVVVIDGACASSCTRYAYPKWHLKVCGTARAHLQFHKPYYVTEATGELNRTAADARMAEIQWKREWLVNMTPAQRDFFKGKRVPSVAAGDSPDRVIDSGDQTGLFLKPCASVLRGIGERPVVTVNGTSDTIAVSKGALLLRRV